MSINDTEKKLAVWISFSSCKAHGASYICSRTDELDLLQGGYFTRTDCNENEHAAPCTSGEEPNVHQMLATRVRVHTPGFLLVGLA